MKFFRKNMRFRLELNDRILNEISSAEAPGEISIGRDGRNTWRLPPADMTASNFHARLFSKRGVWYVEDVGSRNGIYCKGEKIVRRRLAVGDQITIGDSRLVVEPDTDKSEKNAARYHRLEQLNGDQKGRLHDISREIFRIGSAPDCDIVLSDAVISHHHAVLELKSDGTCWIKDCGSRNGTRVNGAPLTGGQNDSGRMLQDGDIIAVAHMEFCFWNRFAPHVRSHFWLKLSAFVITAGVLLGGFFLYRSLTPDAKYYIDQAREHAARKQFRQARELLAQAATVRGADQHRFERGELAGQIDQWEQTIRSWRKVIEHLENKRWISANTVLSPLLSDNMELWRWNDTDAGEAKTQANHAKLVIDTFLAARATMENASVQLPEIDAAIQTLQGALAEVPDYPLRHFQLLRSFAEDILRELHAIRQDLTAIETCLADREAVAHLADIHRRLTEIRDAAAAHREERRKKQQRHTEKIVAYCEALLAPLEKLKQAGEELQQKYQQAAAFRFQALEAPLRLPTLQECSVSPYFSNYRRTLELLESQLKQNVLQLKTFSRLFSEYELEPGRTPPYLERLFRRENNELLLACDSFRQAIPGFNRSEPAGMYDRLVGIEIFFAYLRNLPEKFDYALLEEQKFVPDLYRAIQAYGVLDNYVAFLGRPQMNPVRNASSGESRLMQYFSLADEWFVRREEHLAFLREKAKGGSAREKIIAEGVRQLLAPATTREEREALRQQVSALRRELQALADAGETPEEQLRNQAELLRRGIPGDSIVRLAWSERKEP